MQNNNPARYLACISLDKTTYRPGDIIRARAIILEATNRTPSQTQLSLRFVVTSPRGDSTHEYHQTGTGSAPFVWQIPAHQVGGEYTLTVKDFLDNIVAVPRKFSIQNYRAPRLRTELAFLKKAYGPNDEVIATCSATRSEGGIPEGAAVIATATLGGATIFTQSLTLDAEGNCSLRFTLPAEIKEDNATLSLSIMDGGVQESATKSIPLLIESFSLQFYPEGGDLIPGVENRLYFEAKANTGKPADVSGRIIHKEQTIAHFNTEHEGRGSVSCMFPEDFQGYAVIDSPANVSQVFLLEPRVDWQKKGIKIDRERFVVLSHKETQGTSITLQITSKRKTLLVVKLSHRFGTIASTELIFKSPETQEITLPSAPGFHGVCCVTVFEGDLPCAERLVFIQPKNKIKTTVTLSKNRASPRERIEARIKTTNEAGAPLSALVGVSVVDDAVLSMVEKRERPPRLPEQVLLEPEVESLFDSSAYLNNPRHLDLLLGTQGWRRFAFYLREEFTSSLAPILFAGASTLSLTGRALSSMPDTKPTGVFGRLALFLRSNINELLYKAEEPERMLNQIILEMNTQLIEAKKAVAVAIADEKRLSKQCEAAVLNAKDWEKKAMMASNAGDEALVQQALTHRASHYNLAAAYQREHQKQKDVTDRLKNALRGLQNKIDEVRRKKDLLIARQKRAEAQKTIQSTLTGMSDTSAFETFDRMAQRVDQVEAEAEAQGDLSFDVSNSLNDKFAQLEASPVTDNSLARLKAKMGLAAPIEEQEALVSLKNKMGLSVPVSGVQFPSNMIEAVHEFAYRAPTAEGEARQQFIETLYFHTGLQTDSNGEGIFSFETADSITSYRVMLDAIHQDGALGAEDTLLEVQKFFYVEAKLPFEVSAGDQCQVPVVLVNSTENELRPSLTVSLSGVMSAQETIDAPTLRAQQRGRVLVPVSIGSLHGKTRLSLDAKTDVLSDQVTRELSIAPLGFPHVMRSSGLLKGRAETSFTIPEGAFPGTLAAELRLYYSALTSLEAALEAMLREPYGCFEQTSATTYPNVMILRYLASQQKASPAIAKKALDLIERGYKKLVSFECKGGGFEWFGGSPAHETLTAFGLMEFVDMAKVSSVDAALLKRTSKWLLSRRNGEGGFLYHRGKYAFSSTPIDVADAYITWALLHAGERNLSRELHKSKQKALQSNDPYLIAVTANAMRCAGEPSEDLLALLAAKQDANGSFPGAVSSITSSYGNSLLNETTALAAIALMHSNLHTPEAERAIAFLQTRNTNGAFGSTQATVLCLQALSLLPPVIEEEAPKLVKVSLDGDSREFALDAPLSLPSFGPGSHTLVLETPQARAIPYSLWVGYRTSAPESHSLCGVSLSTTLVRTKVQEGATVDLLVTVSNQTTGELPMTVALIGLPGGVEPRYEQLKELKERGLFDFFELSGRLIILYWRGMIPSEEKTFSLSLLAVIPGSYTGPASRAYLYYSNEWKSWAQPLSIEVLPL